MGAIERKRKTLMSMAVGAQEPNASQETEQIEPTESSAAETATEDESPQPSTIHLRPSVNNAIKQHAAASGANRDTLIEALWETAQRNQTMLKQATKRAVELRQQRVKAGNRRRAASMMANS